MSDDETFHHRILKGAETYARLYPSILPRLTKALRNGHPATRDLGAALSQAIERKDGQRERELQAAFGLSPQEVRITLGLIDGGTVASLAETMTLAESTIRSHIKSVFAKTDCRRQSQLASLLQNGSDEAGSRGSNC